MREKRKFRSEILGATIYPDDNLIAFWGGIFSQWAECSFTCEELLPDVTLNCAEQGMMLMKAKEFGDDRAYEKILSLSNPRDQKAVGRLVENFDAEHWDKVGLDYVTKLNVCKFHQNYAWCEALKLTGDYEIVEASPLDKIWGVGLGEDHPDITDRDKWQGKNYLGIAIMNAREKLINMSLVN